MVGWKSTQGRFVAQHSPGIDSHVVVVVLVVVVASQLGNGVRVATEAGGGPVAALTVSVDLGSRYESPENNGVCSVIGASAFTVSQVGPSSYSIPLHFFWS